jgi:hypothetical protein
VVAPVFTDEEREGLRRFPEIGREDLFRFFTLAPADVAFADPGRAAGGGAPAPGTVPGTSRPRRSRLDVPLAT